MNPLDIIIKTWRERAAGIDRRAVLAGVERDGTMTAGFLLLVATSCAVATLGLLQNSAAVVIGSMLLAPLLGPILRFGFALPRLDGNAMLRGLGNTLAGAAAALAVAMLVVHLSPAAAPTAEILARTQPNLMDLLVALFAGLAGGYAVIRGLSGTFAGFAIATALMPPLATIGFGLARGDAAIALGAGGLFLINFAGIAASAAVMAAWHGLHAPRFMSWRLFLPATSAKPPPFGGNACPITAAAWPDMTTSCEQK